MRGNEPPPPNPERTDHMGGPVKQPHLLQTNTAAWSFDLSTGGLSAVATRHQHERQTRAQADGGFELLTMSRRVRGASFMRRRVLILPLPRTLLRWLALGSTLPIPIAHGAAPESSCR